jgi:recombination protein RecR
MTSDLDTLISLLAKLPGLGPRSAKRAVLHLIKRREALMLPLSEAMGAVAENIKTCAVCGNVDIVDPCAICSDQRRSEALICVVEDVADLWAMERTKAFKGRYHVLGGVLSALDGIGPEDLNIGKLVNRARAPEVTEVILATGATVDGQTTAHYITDRLEDCNVEVSGLAQGIPVGGELDYLDEGTISAALKKRRRLE